jgi:hypothetical protein
MNIALSRQLSAVSYQKKAKPEAYYAEGPETPIKLSGTATTTSELKAHG